MPDAAIDRLRAAAKKIILASPDFQEMLSTYPAHDVGSLPKAAGK